MGVHAKPSTFWAIDFDRCIGNVDRLYGLLEEVVAEIAPLNVTQLEAARKEVELSGGSFDVLGYLRDIKKIDQATYEQVLRTFLERARSVRQQLLEPGAEVLFAYLEECNVPYAIVSYGNPLWQRLKIQAVGYGALPIYITDYPEKGKLIAGWHDNFSGRFTIPPDITGSDVLVVDNVVLVDDKAKAFDGLPLAARGYWVKPLFGELLRSQQGSVPEWVISVRGLEAIIELEKLQEVQLSSIMY